MQKEHVNTRHQYGSKELTHRRGHSGQKKKSIARDRGVLAAQLKEAQTANAYLLEDVRQG